MPKKKAWVLTKVVEEVQPDGTLLRYPKVSRMVDPGRPPTTTLDEETGATVTIYPHYGHSSAVSDDRTKKWCLTLVVGWDLTPLYDDPDVIVLHDYEKDGRLDKALKDEPLEKRKSWRNLLANFGDDVTTFSVYMPKWQVLERLGKRFDRGFEPRKLRAD